MRRLSVTIPDELGEALEKVVMLDPLKRSKSKIVSEALMRYLVSKYPSLILRKSVKGPSVIAALKAVKPRAPSSTYRKSKLHLPEWVKVEGQL